MKKSKWKLTAQEIKKLESERPALNAWLFKQASEAFQLAIKLQSEMAQKELIFGPRWYLI